MLNSYMGLRQRPAATDDRSLASYDLRLGGAVFSRIDYEGEKTCQSWIAGETEASSLTVSLRSSLQTVNALIFWKNFCTQRRQRRA